MLIAVLRKNQPPSLVIDIKRPAAARQFLGYLKFTAIIFVQKGILQKRCIRITFPACSAATTEYGSSSRRKHSYPIAKIIIYIISIIQFLVPSGPHDLTSQDNLSQFVFELERRIPIFVCHTGNIKLSRCIITDATDLHNSITCIRCSEMNAV